METATFYQNGDFGKAIVNRQIEGAIAFLSVLVIFASTVIIFSV